MNLLHGIYDLSTVPGPVFLAIGVFDGVHLGHRAVIQRALSDAKKAGGSAVVVTFDPHPARVLRPGKAPRLLTSTPHKIRLLRALGVGHLLILPFDAALAATAPEDFIRALAAASRPLREICVGHEWSFGKNRAGNLAMLDRLGQQLRFEEVGVPAVEMGGETVSSTLIRTAVESGDFPKASRLLGREYTILGDVVIGQRLGSELGFPTANLQAHSELFPPDGVYAVEALVEGEQRKGVANIGLRPTVEQAGTRRLEVHLFDFDGDLYGAEMEVSFRHFLRGEKRFANIAELRAQIVQDCATARSALVG